MLQVQHSIATTLQEQANNSVQQACISELMSGLQQAKAKYDDAVSVYNSEMYIMTGIKGDSDIADQERRDAAKSFFRAQVTVNQRATTLHYANAEQCTHGPPLSLDTDQILPSKNV